MLALLVLPALASESYPLTDADLLAIRRIETEALYLALKKSGQTRARYARTAIAAHDRRMDRLGPELAAAERRIEREGVDTPSRLVRRYQAHEARQRAVAVGWAMTVLLDDISPDWRSDERPLDILLSVATAGRKPIPLSDDIAAARKETAALARAHKEEASSYLARGDYSLRVSAPLYPTTKDPFVAIGLDDGTRLFRDRVELIGPAGSLAVSGPGAYVDDGEIRVAGLSLDDLVMDHEGDELVVEGPGVALRLRGAVYTGSPSGMQIEVVPGAVMEADPAVFALFALARASGFHGGRSEVADALERTHRHCKLSVDTFRAFAAHDTPGLDAMLAQTVVMGPPPLFTRDRPVAGLGLAAQRDGTFAVLPQLLAEYWACARLDLVWEDIEDDWVRHGQAVLARAAAPLSAAQRVDHTDWPAIRIVPNLFDRTDRGASVSHEGEVSVIVGPPPGRRVGPDPATVVHQVFHHAVDAAARERPCPALDAAHEAIVHRNPGLPIPAASGAWLAESIVRALSFQAGAVPRDIAPEAALATWTAAGFPLIPGILAATKRVPWFVWLEEQCAQPDPRLVADEEHTHPAPSKP